MFITISTRSAESSPTILIEGEKMARAAGLRTGRSRFIRAHHGTSVIQHFYTSWRSSSGIP